MRVGVKPGQYGWSFDELVASWEVAEEAGFDVLACFDHVSSAPRGGQAWDAPSLLVAMAGPTRRITLAVYVVNASLRHPFLLGGQLAVGQALSGGRLEIGIGAGSHYFARYDHEDVGIPFPSYAERLARVEACCRTLPALWRGEEVTDEALGMTRASLGPIGIAPPPILVGGTSDRALEVAVHHADGWHAPGMESAEFADVARRLDRTCQEAGRPLLRKTQMLAELERLGLPQPAAASGGGSVPTNGAVATPAPNTAAAGSAPARAGAAWPWVLGGIGTVILVTGLLATLRVRRTARVV